MTCFCGAYGTGRSRVEEKHHRAVDQQFTQAPDVPQMVWESKIRRDIASTHDYEAT